MPGPVGDKPEPRGHESCGKVSETLGILDGLKFGSSFSQRSAEKREIKERDSVPQYTEQTTPRPTTDHVPESSSVEVDPDQQFLQSLLPALRRMDLRRREFTKAVIHQIVYEIEFNERSDLSSLGAEAVQRLQTSVWEQDGGRASPVSSYLSMRSDASIPLPPNFSVSDRRSSPASSLYSDTSDRRIPH